MSITFGRILRLAAAALLLAASAGCLPNVTWLPDSSGFAYTGGPNKDTLYLYDLDKKEQRVLVEKGAGPTWPAVSPDGKRIAVALRHDDGKEVALEAVVFDRDGKELHRSPKLEWGKGYKDLVAAKVAAKVFWIPEQDQLLLCNDSQTGVYDIKTKALVKWEYISCEFGASPIRPDGKGFMALKKGEGLDIIVFVDWNGKEQVIEPNAKDAYKVPLDGHDYLLGWMMLRGMIDFPPMHQSSWDGSTAKVSWDDVRVVIDTDKGGVTIDHVKPLLSADKKLIAEQFRLEGGGLIRAVELSKRYQRESPDSHPFGSYRLEVVKPGATEPKTFMDEVPFFLISPSPDGKRAVVRCFRTQDAIYSASKPEQDMLYLIDSQGDVTAKIDLAK